MRVRWIRCTPRLGRGVSQRSGFFFCVLWMRAGCVGCALPTCWEAVGTGWHTWQLRVASRSRGRGLCRHQCGDIHAMCCSQAPMHWRHCPRVSAGAMINCCHVALVSLSTPRASATHGPAPKQANIRDGRRRSIPGGGDKKRRHRAAGFMLPDACSGSTSPLMKGVGCSQLRSADPTALTQLRTLQPENKLAAKL